MKNLMILFALISGLTLAGCTDELYDELTEEGDIGDSYSSSGNDCDLSELISEADRSSANACGIQASSQIANADVYYSAAVSACRSGETGVNPDTGATTTYRDTYEVYKTAANYALQVVDGLGCGTSSSGGSGGFEVPDNDVTQYNLCVGYIDGGTRALGTCYGPVDQYDYSCGDNQVNYISNYPTSGACITARDDWLSAAFD